MNGILWRIEVVPHNSLMLVDRTGNERLATTDPEARKIFLSNELHGEFQERVLIHELGHCAIFSFNLQYDIHKGVKKEYWLEAEEWLCNFIAEYGQRIFETASSLEIVPQKVEEIVMNL